MEWRRSVPEIVEIVVVRGVRDGEERVSELQIQVAVSGLRQHEIAIVHHWCVKPGHSLQDSPRCNPKHNNFGRQTSTLTRCLLRVSSAFGPGGSSAHRAFGVDPDTSASLPRHTIRSRLPDSCYCSKHHNSERQNIECHPRKYNSRRKYSG